MLAFLLAFFGFFGWGAVFVFAGMPRRPKPFASNEWARVHRELRR